MNQKKPRQRLFLLALALLTIALSWWGVVAARSPLVVRSQLTQGVPLLYIAPQAAKGVPGVLVAHGFAGSKQLMLGYGHVLAHAGYAVMLWDFSGHGSNTTPMNRLSLSHDLDLAYNALLEQPEVDPSRLALLGHSMGSGVVMSAGIRNLDFAATIAVSPTGAAVSSQAPRNLQLQAGSWEGGFVSNAQRLLARSGGENENLAEGKGRSLVLIPNAEHITILLRNASHQAARSWLDATFGIQNSSNYVDRRMAWYGLHLLGWLLALAAIAQELTFTTVSKQKNSLRNWGGLLLAPFVASGVLLLLSRGIDLQSLGGIQVGGAVGIWFFVAGLVWLSIIAYLPRPKIKSVVLGLLLFALLWIAFGAMAQFVWLQWWLVPARLKLWPLLALGCFPWFLALGIAQQNSGVGKRIWWWLATSATLVGGFLLTLQLLPQLSFIFLLLPLFPIFMALLSFAAAQLNEATSFAIGSALFFAWAIAAAFPLSS